MDAGRRSRNKRGRQKGFNAEDAGQQSRNQTERPSKPQRRSAEGRNQNRKWPRKSAKNRARRTATEAELSVKHMGSKRFNAEIAEGRRETQRRQIIEGRKMAE